MWFRRGWSRLNGPGRIRTCDLGIKSPLLCQLSYRPSHEGWIETTVPCSMLGLAGSFCTASSSRTFGRVVEAVAGVVLTGLGLQLVVER